MSFGPVLDAALEMQAACQQAGFRGCIIGGVALQRWGEPRFTASAEAQLSGAKAKVDPGRSGQQEVVADK